MHGRGDLPAATSVATLRPRIERQSAAALRAMMSRPDAAADEEYRITLLADAPAQGEGGDVQLRVLAEVMAYRPPPRVVCLAGGRPRRDARAKDSDWVRQRAALEAEKVAGVEEVVLVGAGGALMEGTQTNFFAVLDGAVHTAGEGVLEGTVRALLLDACAAAGIPVRLQAPSLADLPRWEGCLIGSTSRLALPVHELRMLAEAREELAATAPDVLAACAPATEAPRLPAWRFPAADDDSSVVRAVQRAVQSRFGDACEPLPEAEGST